MPKTALITGISGQDGAYLANMGLRVKVMYEDGVLKPLEKIGLGEGEEIEIELFQSENTRNSKVLRRKIYVIDNIYLNFESF